jgi:hypothetical protein
MENFMKNNKLQTKDIPKVPVLVFLKQLNGKWGTIHPGFNNSVLQAMPANIAPKLAASVMRTLIGNGLIDGCACGCRGDFELTEKGKEVLDAIYNTTEEHDETTCSKLG